MVSQDQSKAADQKQALERTTEKLLGTEPRADLQATDEANLTAVSVQHPNSPVREDDDLPSQPQISDSREADDVLAESDEYAQGSLSTDDALQEELKVGSTELAKQDLKPRSWARVWRQLAFAPLKNRWLNKAAHERIEAAIKLAEENHFGEIVVVIEDTLPLWQSLKLDAHTRALDVFASQRVWDTERNSGVLIYLCLSEHALEIVVDRGLNQTIDPIYWRAVCDKTLAGIKRGEPVRALEFLIRHVGKALRLFDQSGTDPSGNELGNQVIRL
jgi:uncharacterized membrane protein